MIDTAAVAPSVRPAGFARWVLLGAVLLPLVYLGTLTTRFDFIDDGNLVYPTHGLPLGERLQVVWGKIEANYDHLGPFRPVLWCHWELAADLLDGSEFGWRLTRLVWCGLATLMLLWLFAELRMAPWAALAAAAVAMWNPYRNEIWTSLTLSEGVAMPYALLALVCACRAPRARRPWSWDLLGVACVLAALGCKNTFAALVPAQMFLRLAPDQGSLREGWRLHGRRALLLGLTLLAPVAHFIYFKLHWHPGQYVTEGASVAQLRRIGWNLLGAVSIEFVGPGLALAVVALVAARQAAAGLLARHRAALGAGLLLLLGGTALYLPVGNISGRYSMPAVWGLDLAVAALLTELAGLRPTRWTRVAWGALAIGLAGVMVASVGRQQKFAARARLLWETLEYVESHAPREARIAWIVADGPRDSLNVEEGIHFQWHLKARGRREIHVGLYDDHGQPLRRPELPPPDGEPVLVIAGAPGAGEAGDWQVRQRFVDLYWGGLRRYECYVLASPDGGHAESGVSPTSPR